MFSVKEQLRGGAVLLTGALGFLGSVALEKLLRATEVSTVYVLVRGKKNVPPAKRVEKLLCGPLFHLLHKQAAEGLGNAFAKVHVVEGDLDLPGLGLSKADRQLLLDDVTTVIHCAADLTLDAHIHAAIRANYCSTKELVQLAAGMSRLQSFVYTSTFFVNNFLPYNTPVKEHMHAFTLQLPGASKALSHAEFVDTMLALPGREAAKEAAALMARLNFVSTYAFSKVLAEQMFDEPDCLPDVAKAIVRPSLITNTAYGPYPGYLGGFAGSPGYCIGYGIGFFHDTGSIAFSSDCVIDIIPCDTVAALLVAAAAGAAAHGPYAGGRARVYHCASAESHPEGAPGFFQRLKVFWSTNPPPFRLPASRYPNMPGRHQPTPKSIKAGRRAVGRKVWATSRLLRLAGQPWKAANLVNGFKAFCVQNNIGYARSIVSCVDNARQLEQSMLPEERAEWHCLWDKDADLDWDTYSYTSLAGQRCLAFKLPEEELVTPVAHLFKRMPALTDPALLYSTPAPRGATPLPAAPGAAAAAGLAKAAHSSSSSSSRSLGSTDAVRVTFEACGQEADGSSCSSTASRPESSDGSSCSSGEERGSGAAQAAAAAKPAAAGAAGGDTLLRVRAC